MLFTSQTNSQALQRKWFGYLFVLQLLLAVVVLSSIMTKGATQLTAVRTRSYQPCNTKPPLTCTNSLTSTILEVDFEESLNGQPMTSIVSNWTVVAASVVANQLNNALNACTCGNCTVLPNAIQVETEIIGANVVFNLDATNTFIPYGYYLTAQTNGQNNGILANPSLWNSSITCYGQLASMKPATGQGCPVPLFPNLSDFLGLCGSLTDQVMLTNSTWLPLSASNACNGVLCYTCPSTSAPVTQTLFRVNPFGPKCWIYNIQNTANLMSYEIDVRFTITTLNTSETITFSSQTNTGGNNLQAPNPFLKGSFVKLDLDTSHGTRLQNFVTEIDGGAIVVCSGNSDTTKFFNQGITSPWQNQTATNVPTATSTGTNQMWFYLSAADYQRYIGNTCGKQGSSLGYASKLATANLTNACINGYVAEGYCIPGYSNSTYTPCQISHQLNLYASECASGSCTPQPQFLPPGWNPTFTPYYLREIDNSYQLVYETFNFKSLGIKGTYAVQVSNDLLGYSRNMSTIGASIRRNETFCRYFTSSQDGYIVFNFCNTGNQSTTYQLELLSCPDGISFLDLNGTFPFHQTLTIPSGGCEYTKAYYINSTINAILKINTTTLQNFTTNALDPNATALSPYTASQIAYLEKLQRVLALNNNNANSVGYLGMCQFRLWNEDFSIPLIGTFDNPEKIVCLELVTPIRTPGSQEFINCTIWDSSCSTGWYWIMIVSAVILGFVLLAASVVGIVLYFSDKKRQADARKKNEFHSSVNYTTMTPPPASQARQKIE